MNSPQQNIFKKPQKYLGPSQFATVLELSHFDTPESLKEKIERGFWQTVRPQMTFGINFEKNALNHYEKQTGLTITAPKWKTLNINPRIGGFADGLVYKDNKLIHGVEIKCHPNKTVPLQKIPDYYLVQIAGYMALYEAPAWELMSVCFNQSEEIYDYKIHHITWESIKDRWENDWYPKLNKFINSISWAY